MDAGSGTAAGMTCTFRESWVCVLDAATKPRFRTWVRAVLGSTNVDASMAKVVIWLFTRPPVKLLVTLPLEITGPMKPTPKV